MKKKLLILCLFCFGAISAMGQGKISGTIVDESRMGLPGATVVLEGTARGVTAGPNGVFSIDVAEFPAKITYSFVGYMPQTVDYSASTANLNIVLAEEGLNIEDVVVVGYGTQKKESVVGAISTATAKDLVKAPVSNVGSALTGRLTGLTTIQSSGQPGQEMPTLRIRGVSGTSNSSPLVIVDGVERASGGRTLGGDGTTGARSGWEGLNPNDIESVSILKDASATAVYGVKGANGVIIITTKKGRSGETSVNYNGSFGLTTPIRPKRNLGSYEYGMYANEAMYNDGKPAYMSFDRMMRYRYNYDPLLYPSMDYYDYMYNKWAPQHSHDVNISGGSDKVQFYTSVGYYKQEGNLKNFDEYGFDGGQSYERLNLRSNLDFKFTDRLSASVKLDGRVDKRMGPNAPYDSHMFWKLYQSRPWASPGFDDQGRLIRTEQMDNMPLFYWILGGGNYTQRQVQALTVFELNYKLDFVTEGLSARALYQFDTWSEGTINRSRSYATYMPIEVDGGVYLRKDGEDGWLGKSGWNNNKGREESFQLGFNYARTFGDHSIAGLALYNAEKRRYRESSFAEIPHGYMGFVGRVEYNFKNRYFAEFNIGINGSENFPKGKRFGTFPAVSAGWLISEEPFMEDIKKTVSFLRIRGSYGLSGNDKIGQRFLYLPTTYANFPAEYYLRAGEPTTGMGAQIAALKEGKAPNFNVTWETAYKTNIGLDAKFFDNRLNLVFDVFHERYTDILVNMQSYPSFLYTQIALTSEIGANNILTPQNYAATKNKGFELELGWDGKIGKDWTYFIKGTFAYSKSHHTKVSEQTYDYPYLFAQGAMVGEIRGYIAEGYWTSYEEINNPNNPVNSFGTSIPGDIKYKDINGDMKIDNKDIVPLGYSNTPRTTYTGQLGFSWKNFDVSALFQGATDFMFMPSEEQRVMMNEGWGAFTWMNERWTPQLGTGHYPVLRSTFNITASSFQGSSYWAYDASYIRLRNLEISYNLPRKWMDAIDIENIRISLTGQNLWTYTPTYEMNRFDPEAIQNRLYYTPMGQVYNIGVSINF